MSLAVDHVLTLLTAHRYTWADERELQKHLATVLARTGATVQREVPLDETSRLDLLVNRIGIEVKVKGSAVDALRQLQRYAHSDLVDELVLATTRAAHRALPATVGGKPLTVAYLTHIA